MCVVLQDELNRRFAQQFCLSLTHQVPDDQIKVIICHVYRLYSYLGGWRSMGEGEGE